MTMFSRLLLACVLALLLMSPAHAQQEALAPPVVAVVDMDAIFQQLDERQAIEQDHAQAVQKLRAGQQQRLDKIKSLQLDLKMLDDGSVDQQAKQEQVVEETAMARAWMEIQQQKVARQTAVRIDAMRQKMIEAVAAVASERNIDLVLNKAVQLSAPAAGRGQKPTVKSYPVVIWSNGRAEITNEVASRMNVQFQSP